MKTVVTMTCWTKRINQMPFFLDYFFATQTKKPDLFYLWLATEEFPDHILPLELLVAIQKYDIILKWIEKNEYVHKRWRVYPEHFEDVVISLDEDRKYPNDLVEQSVNCKYITNLYIPRVEQKYENIDLGFCGQCIIPPKTFPMEAYNIKYLNDRLEYSPKSDECWLNLFLLKNNIKITTDMSLYLPPEIGFECADDDTALYKHIGVYKPKIFKDLTNYMTKKYNFEVDMNKVNRIVNYMNIHSK